MIVIRVFGDVLPDDFFCEQAGRRTAAAFGLWLFLPCGEGVGTDAVPGRYCAIGAIFKFCKDFWWWPEKYAGLDKAIVDVVKS